MQTKILRFSAFTAALSYIVLSLIVLLMFAMPLAYGWKQIVEKRSVESLQTDAERLSRVYKEHGIPELNEVIKILNASTGTGDESFIVLVDSSRKPVAGNLSVWPAKVPVQPGIYKAAIQYNNKTADVIFVSRELPDHFNLLVGRNNSNLELVETLFWSGLFGTIGVIFLFGLVGRRIIRAALLDEISQISTATAAIIGGDLSRRLPQKHNGNELDLLAVTVNRTLDQIEHLIHANRQVSDSIAHDLRTPLAELRFRLESLTTAQRPVEEMLNEIDASIVDVDRVIMVFNALLRLAEIDHGARRAGFEQVNINKMIEDVVDFYQPLAELKSIPLVINPGETMSAKGDGLLLAQAIGNLIDNALKYTNSKVWIELSNQPDTGWIAITVSDDGIGISAEDKPRVVERFYRSATSRGTDGVGLGLCLVAAVARLHGGSFELSDGNPGLHATLLIQSGSVT